MTIKKEIAVDAARIGRNTSEDDRLAYSVDEFCRLFGISRSAFYGLVSTGKLKTAKILSKTIVTTVETRRFAASLDEAAA